MGIISQTDKGRDKLSYISILFFMMDQICQPRSQVIDLMELSGSWSLPRKWQSGFLVSTELTSTLRCQRGMSWCFELQQLWNNMKIFLRTAFLRRMYTQGSRIWFHVAIRTIISRLKCVDSSLTLVVRMMIWIWVSELQNNINYFFLKRKGV